MARAIRSDVQTDGDVTARPWARAWISSSYVLKKKKKRRSQYNITEKYIVCYAKT